MSWDRMLHDELFDEPKPDPLDRLPRGRQIVGHAARRGGYLGACAGFALGFVVIFFHPGPEPRRDEIFGPLLHGFNDRIVPALVCIAIGSLLGGAIGYAAGESVGERQRREVEGE
jgi:hypothetical protein